MSVLRIFFRIIVLLGLYWVRFVFGGLHLDVKKKVRCTVFREFTNDNFKNSDEVQKTTLQTLIDICIMKNNCSGLELSLGGIQTTFPE